jgi:hypothetical protein
MTGPDPAGFLLSPAGLLIAYGWTFASLAAVQLTVRLILRFDLRETALAALWLTIAAVVLALIFFHLSAPAPPPSTANGVAPPATASPLTTPAVVQQRLAWTPLVAIPLLAVTWWVARRVLGMRPRAAAVCALAMALLIVPWLPFL